MTPGRFWTAFAVVGLAVEAFGLSHPDRNDWTLCPNARRLLHADTPAGRAFIKTSIGAGATVLVSHLINTPPPKESQ